MDGFGGNAEVLEKFFSNEMYLYRMRFVLQYVEWNMEVEDGCREILSIAGLGGAYGVDELTGEISTAYGTDCSYCTMDTSYVDLYSFEFNSLVSSYPFREVKFPRHNREEVTVGLAHSVILAKHLGVEKLKAIRRYYNGHCLPLGKIRRDAFKRLLQQTVSRISDDDERIWRMFESDTHKIPLFPYRMQAVALWDEATNWRVLQASAHQDILLSRVSWETVEAVNQERMPDNARHEKDIFNYCAEWSMGNTEWKGSLGVVMETVRTFLAEWIVGSGQVPVWEQEVPASCFDFKLIETSVRFNSDIDDPTIVPQLRPIWICQRELQTKVARSWKNDENLPGNAELIMLFMLGFPLLRVEKVQDAKNHVQPSQDEVRVESVSSSSNRDRSVDVSVQEWRIWTPLEPEDISLMIRLDLTRQTLSLRLQTNSDDGRFTWQDWVDAAMGYMKGVEEHGDGDWGYGRQIVRADLRKPMVELCPLRLDEDGIEAAVEKTSTARVWLGWPVFDVKICKFEMDQWLAACDADSIGGLKYKENWEVEEEVAKAEQAIGKIISVDKDMEGLAKDGEV